MKPKRHLLFTILLFALAAALTICVLSSACSAQSRDDRKDKTGDRKSEKPKRAEPKRDETKPVEPKRAEPKRDDRSERGTSRDTRREPVRKSRDGASGGDGTARERSSRGGTDSAGRKARERDSSRDRGTSGGTGDAGGRTPPARGSSGGATAVERRRPPVRPNPGSYDRRRDDDGGGSGLRPGNTNPPARPPRTLPEEEAEGGTKKKEVPAPGDRMRVITEGWLYPPPWHRDYVRIWHQYPGFPPEDPYRIHLPFGTIRPREIDEGFLLLLDDLWKDGMEDALLVCVVQTYRPMETYIFERFFDAEDDATVYGSFSDYSFLVLLSVYTIDGLLDDPRVRWIGEYEPRYKINRNVRLWEYDGAFVFPLEGDTIECRDDLTDIFLVPEFYDEELGFYFVPAEAYELEAISEFWWVAEVVRVASDPALVSDYETGYSE